MLEQIALSSGISKESYKIQHDELISRLVVLQQQAQRAGLGVVVLFEGWDGSGKGSRISDLMYNLDARATHVHLLSDDFEHDARMFKEEKLGSTSFYPLMTPFWKNLGSRGEMTIYERGWYTAALRRAMYVDRKKSNFHYFDMINGFEKTLVDDGYVLVKFFLHVSESVQRKRLTKLHTDHKTSWRVSERELARMADYHELYGFCDEFLTKTNFSYAPWTLVNGEDKRSANLTIARTLVEALEAALHRSVDPEQAAAAKKAVDNSIGAGGAEVENSEEVCLEISRRKAVVESSQAPIASRFEMSEIPVTLEDVRHDLALTEEEYRLMLKEEQKRFAELELKMYRHRIPLMIVYEGDDAAGKGGNIKRVAQALDARAYTVFPSPAPTRTELLHPHLWRYWTRLPKAGHVGIYDRSWYGRVMVERVEGFASPDTWARAYDEINQFEAELTNWGAILLKFWVSVDRDEQLARFHAREEDPNKRWKITDEDWRNRNKYPQYNAAVEDMFRLTSTKKAPWIILESDNKYYARIKALKIINEALEERLKQVRHL